MSAAVVKNDNVPAVVAVAENKAKKQKTSLKKNISAVDFNGPSRAPSGFFLYSHEVREAVTAAIRASLKDGETFAIRLVGAKIGEQWKSLPETDRTQYNEKAKVLKAKYDTDLEQWKLTADYKAFVKASALHNKKKADKKAKDAAKASGMPARPMAGYMRFAQVVRDEVRKELEAKGEKFSVTSSAPLIKAKWTALGEDGQKQYNDEFSVAKAKYDADLKAWQETDAGKALAKAKKTNAKRKAQNSKVGKPAKKAKGNNGEAVEEQEEEESIELEESIESSIAEGEEEEVLVE